MQTTTSLLKSTRPHAGRCRVVCLLVLPAANPKLADFNHTPAEL